MFIFVLINVIYMDEVLLLKGKYEVINLPQFHSKAEKLYDFLSNIFKSKGFGVRVVESEPEYSVVKKIYNNTIFVVGHSRGANKILKEFNPQSFPQVRGIVLFDPIEAFSDEWNKLSVPKLLFVSEWGHDYSDFKDVNHLIDDHYFNKNLKKIGRKIELFLS